MNQIELQLHEALNWKKIEEKKRIKSILAHFFSPFRAPLILMVHSKKKLKTWKKNRPVNFM